MPDNKNESNGRPPLGSVFLSGIRWFAKQPRRPPGVPAVIVPTESGFKITVDGEVRRVIEWTHVVQVVAYKQDLVSTDLIWIGFVMRGDRNHIWEVHEELEGYEQIQKPLDLLTHGAWPGRFGDVAYPAFETNFTILWTAEGEPGASDDPVYVPAWVVWSPETD